MAHLSPSPVTIAHVQPLLQFIAPVPCVSSVSVHLSVLAVPEQALSPLQMLDTLHLHSVFAVSTLNYPSHLSDTLDLGSHFMPLHNEPLAQQCKSEGL